MTSDIWNGNGNWTLNPTDWSTGAAPSSAMDAVIATGTNTLTATEAVHSVMTIAGATLNVSGAVTLTTTTAFNNAGVLDLETSGATGGTVTIGTIFANSGTAFIGYTGLGGNATVTAKILANSGTLVLQGNNTSATTHQATLNVASVALATITGSVEVRGDAMLEFASGSVSSIAAGALLELDGAKARVSDGNSTTNSALTGLATIAGQFLLRGNSSNGAGGASVTTGNLVNTGQLNVDVFGGDGGSLLTVGVLTNSGTTTIGNTGLGANTNVSASGLSNTGTVVLQGNSVSSTTDQATLNVNTVATASIAGTIAVRGDAMLEFASGSVGAITTGALLELDGAKARISDGNSTTNSALSGLTTIAGQFLLRGNSSNGAGGASVTTTGNLTNTGQLNVDVFGGDGGSSLSVKALTNSGTTTIGNTGLSANTTVTATGLANTGTLTVQGNNASGTTDQATLNVTAAAPALVAGTIAVRGDAMLEFASKSVGEIGAGAVLELDGAKARISDGNSTTNSALSGLVTIEGELLLRGNSSNGAGGVAVTTAGNLNNTAQLNVDVFGGDGGSTLSVKGLTNSGFLAVGNTGLSGNTTLTATSFKNNALLQLQGNNQSGTTDQATFDITSAAIPTLIGTYEVRGDAMLEFTSGSIGAIGVGGLLEIDGAKARVSDGSSMTNSALSGLATIAGELLLRGNSSNGAGGTSITTTANLNVTGELEVDTFGGDGGSTMSVKVLTNSSGVTIGNTGLSANTTVTATSLKNTGSLTLQGNNGSATTNQATLNVTTTAIAAIAGAIEVRGDAMLEFASKSVGSVAAGSLLELDGAKARISDGDSTTNSALSGLVTVAGEFLLRGNSSNGAGGVVVATTGNLNDTGQIELDTFGGDGGSSLSVKGLTDSNSIAIGNTGLSANTTLTATSFKNTGTVVLQGNNLAGTTDQATFDITAAATPALAGTIAVRGDAMLEYASGQVTSIAAGALLEIDGAKARVSDGNSTTNSALAGLATVSGELLLRGNSSNGAGGVAITTTGNLKNTGQINIDTFGGDGGSSLSVKAFANSAFVGVGNTALSASTNVTATSLDNLGTITLTGNGGNLATLTVNGKATNESEVVIAASGVLDVTGANEYLQDAGTTIVVGKLVAPTIDVEGGLVDFSSALTSGNGTGALNIFANGTLEFGAGVDASHTVQFEAATGTLELGSPGTFAGTIAGFTGNDVIDLLNTPVTSFAFAGGKLTLKNGATTVATLAFTGSYTTASFATVTDGNGGTDILDPPPEPASPAKNAADRLVQAMASFGVDLGTGGPHWVGKTDDGSAHLLAASSHG